MAEKQFIKMYTVNKKDFDDNGELKPDAPLYPFYSGIYGMNSQEKFGEPAVYDNENNIHPLRRALLTDRRNAAEGVFDAPTYKVVGPNMKRGFSVNSYAGPYKRSTDPDKMNEFDDWTKDPVHIPKDAPDEVAHILEENRLNRSTLYPTMKFTKHPTYEDEDRKLWRDEQIKAFGPNGEIGEYFKYKTGDYTPRGSDDDFVRIPMIVTADDSDIVTIDDVLNDNYEPLRDYKNEEHIKKINARKLPSGLIVPSGTVTKDDIKKAKDFYKYMWNELSKFVIDASSKEICSNFYENAHLCTANNHFDLEKLFNTVYEVRTKLQDTFDTIKPYTSVDDLLALSQGSVEEATDMLDKYVRESSDKDIEPTWGMYEEYILAHDYVRRALYVLEEFIIEQAANKSNITVNSDIWNNVQDWFAYDNPDTSSDERIKDIHKCLSDEGCTDVILSDNQMQQVKDDFNNWLKFRENHANICDGLKELGQ